MKRPPGLLKAVIGDQDTPGVGRQADQIIAGLPGGVVFEVVVGHRAEQVLLEQAPADDTNVGI